MMNVMKTPLSSYLATSSEKKPIPKWFVFASSGIGGCMGWSVVHPANTVAVRMSLAAMNGKQFSFKTMVAESGLMSVYDGLSAGLLRQVFYATARFGLFETFRDYAHEIRGKTDFAAR
jgi:solute carrier family 25 oxoglutarate transporter 11